MSAVFYHTEEQKRLILQARDRLFSDEGGTISTQILPASEFYPAEEYHQKYSLQKEKTLMKIVGGLYPDRQALFDSPVAARLNGYLAGYSTFEELKRALVDLDLPPMIYKKVLDSVPILNR